MCELDLYPFITCFFSDKSLMFREVPFSRKRIDLLYANDSLTTLYSVEAKLGNWKVALKQAAINQIISHYSFVAIPKKKTDRFSKEIFKVFEHYGVGILSVSETTELLLKPKRSEFFNKTKYQKVKKNLRYLIKNNSNDLTGFQDYDFSNRTFSMEFLQARSH